MRSWYIVLLMVLFPFVPYFAEQYFVGRIDPPLSVSDVVSSLMLIILLVWWVLRDSAERNLTVPYYLKILIVLIAVIGLPIYLFRSRGFKGGLLALAAAVCVGVVITTSGWIGAVAGEYTATFLDQTPKRWSRCSGQDNVSLDSRIESCTAMINSLRAWRHKKSDDARFHRGRAYYEKGDRERAIADLRRAVEDTVSPGKAALNRAICDFSHQVDLSVSFLCGRPRR